MATWLNTVGNASKMADKCQSEGVHIFGERTVFLLFENMVCTKQVPVVCRSVVLSNCRVIHPMKDLKASLLQFIFYLDLGTQNLLMHIFFSLFFSNFTLLPFLSFSLSSMGLTKKKQVQSYFKNVSS